MHISLFLLDFILAEAVEVIKPSANRIRKIRIYLSLSFVTTEVSVSLDTQSLCQIKPLLFKRPEFGGIVENNQKTVDLWKNDCITAARCLALLT